jgi:hypothetical protein
MSGRFFFLRRTHGLYILSVSFHHHLECVKRYSVVELCSLVFCDIVPDLQSTNRIFPYILAHRAVDLTGLVQRHVAEDDALYLNGDFDRKRVRIGIDESVGGAVGLVVRGA